MAAVTTALTAIGLGISAAGVGLAYKGHKDAAEAGEKAEKAREKAMNLDAQRRRRQVIREMQLAQSTALANATSQGAAEGSGLQGGYGEISNTGRTNIVGINQQQQLGADIFSANRAQASANSRASMGNAFQSVGGMMIEQRQEIARVGATLFA